MNTIQQENITLVTIYPLNIGLTKYIKQILMNIRSLTEITVIVNFNSSLTSMDRKSTKKQ